MVKPATADQDNLTRWQKALRDLTPMNRVHAGPEMAKAYRTLREYYSSCEIFGYESGSTSGNWIAPPGWIVHHARLTGPDGKTIIDYGRDNILCLYCYSPSFEGTLPKAELEKHLFSNPNHPKAYPYYFRNMYRFATGPEWGFCIPHEVRETLPEGNYKIDIKTEFTKDPMEMALETVEGENPESLLMVGHFDHPAQCGDGLLGCIAGHEILDRLRGRKTKLTYRMLSTVEIVGSVFYAEERAAEDNVKETLFTALSGIEGPLLYAQSVSEQAKIDEAMRHVLKFEEEENSVTHFRGAAGNDETAFDVQGVNIPSGSLMRYPFKYYHTSLDTDDRVDFEKFENFISVSLSAIDILEQNATLKMTHKGLPCLSHPDLNLYLTPLSMSGMPLEPDQTSKRLLDLLPDEKARKQAYKVCDRFNQMMTLLPALADGNNTTLDIAERVGVPFSVVHAYTELWVEKGIMEKKWVHPFKS
jgi:aminopeptidase-like protein